MKDILGDKITIGDKVAYGMRDGNTGALSVYKVLSVGDQECEVEPIISSKWMSYTGELCYKPKIPRKSRLFDSTRMVIIGKELV